MSQSDERYFLYGSHASYHTAKLRSYLRKKGIPFEERLPAHPRFREHVRPSSGNHRIPQIEAPDGTVVQDSISVFDFLEGRFPEPPARPPGPRQQLTARLFEVLLDAELGRPAWHYRWNFMEENYGFVGREFGRSFRPQGSDEELDHYGGIIAERMEGKRAGLGDSPELRSVLEAIYLEVLALLEEHFVAQPYLFGGLPSIADHVLMGSLFGHLARDPVPSTLMKQRAPRVFRWTEHMNTPEIRSPEHDGVPAAYLPDDEIGEPVAELLRLCIADVGGGLASSFGTFDSWVEQQGLRPGDPVSEKSDEPVVGRGEATLRGVPVPGGAAVYPLWVLQRGLDWLDSLGSAERRRAVEWVSACGGEALVTQRLAHRVTRAESRMLLA